MKITQGIPGTIVSLLALAVAASTARGQTDRLWLTAGTSNYATTTNWTAGFVPDAAFNERAIINNGGAAVLTSSAPAPSAVVLGLAAADSGTLEIGAGGNLSVDFLTGNLGIGNVTVGAAGRGTLRVLPGGTLETDADLTSGNNPLNTIVLGGTAAGTATVNVGTNTNFGGTTQAFPNINFNSTGTITFMPSSAYQVNITAAGSPKLKSNLSVVLDGTLTANFSGVTPAVGSSWDLFDVGAVAGSFTSINATGAPSLAAGTRYAVTSVPAPSNRARGVLVVEQFLQLNVDRNTGAISISNAAGQQFGVQGYTINSPNGSLSTSGWNSLDDQNSLGGDWKESNPSATRLSELKPTGPANLAATSNTALGNAFVPNPAVFGTPVEDLTFQYVKSDGSVATGTVTYTGALRPNNLLLTVDPTTGAAQVKNTSTLPVSIDGYSIMSASNSLSITGWNSLDDQNAAGGDWRESNPKASRLSELKPTTSTTVTPGTAFSLGNLFNVGGTQDLSFIFSIANQGNFTGVVTYGPISTAGLAGDYNNNGTVDAADYVVWRDNVGAATLPNRSSSISGQVGTDDYNFWRSRFGLSGGSGAAALGAASVPEPATACLVVLAAAAFACRNGKRPPRGRQGEKQFTIV